MLASLGVDRGICVLVAKAPTELPLALGRHSQLVVYVQLPDDDSVLALRRQADAAGLLGTRVYVEKGIPAHLHLANNLADAVVVPADISAADVFRDELLRVVRPLGKILLGQEPITKPYPPEAADWTHPYCAPDNNPQSQDRLAKAPYLTQFLAEPWYVPFPEVTVASQGRIARIAPESRGQPQPAATWQSQLFEFPVAVALGNNAVVIAGRLPAAGDGRPQFALAALAVEDGHLLWREPLPSMPIPWGLALDRAGRSVVSVEDGRVLAFAAP